MTDYKLQMTDGVETINADLESPTVSVTGERAT
jgi:hypothetical protein